jgi:hypothetical protein
MATAVGSRPLDPTGKHIGFIGVAHDVTSAKQAERDLRRLNEIRNAISERTAQLGSMRPRCARS